MSGLDASQKLTVLTELIQLGVTHESMLAWLGATLKEPRGDSRDLLEAMAAVEHSRWASWQRHLHAKCSAQEDGSLVIPSSYVASLERQIATPYAQLSEREKDSDRAEARKSLEVVVAHGWGAPGKRGP